MVPQPHITLACPHGTGSDSPGFVCVSCDSPYTLRNYPNYKLPPRAWDFQACVGYFFYQGYVYEIKMGDGPLSESRYHWDPFALQARRKEKANADTDRLPGFWEDWVVHYSWEDAIPDEIPGESRFMYQLFYEAHVAAQYYDLERGMHFRISELQEVSALEAVRREHMSLPGHTGAVA
uniref:Uncharacterized protein n=1 Tax=Chromera velia CCMP2878 TaxID=1169474 RepID=A0A0G4HJ86_9ALVE|eukprot:Cvel_28033.t1-p1 / transcript=Cvel_28033.t1 / gene=Cvel_28033 / organism=Chromera_velia_CCMP2878 / gene_product=hypothetical protein / transcript_product=hypothetical protein / location=Cvel_scaffold3600:14787-15317(+) / protein_length=177 / sequence_SO=supercontig / SO=protein_coding / is_pseudo=false